jgi:hypothetical protein
MRESLHNNSQNTPYYRAINAAQMAAPAPEIMDGMAK